MKFVLIGFLSAVLLITACATQKSAQSEDIDVLAGLMVGTFETPSTDTENIIRDRRVRVSSPSMGGIWFYTQLNTGEEGKLYRQRLLNLTLSDDGQTIIQVAYGLKEPEKYADAWRTPELLSTLTRDDVEPYFTKGCEQVWTPGADASWTGYVDPQTCVVTSKRRNKDIRIESEGYLSKGIYRTNERGYEMDMTFLWGTQPGEFITLYRVK